MVDRPEQTSGQDTRRGFLGGATDDRPTLAAMLAYAASEDPGL